MENPEELRAYFFNNMYLQGIHAGIQAQHCTAEMFIKYSYGSTKDEYLCHWAKDHKTTIILNGGYVSNLERISSQLSSPDNPYPWAYFQESEDALNNCITSVGIILPKRVFEGAKYMSTSSPSLIRDRYIQSNNITSFELQIMKELSQCNLMT